MSNIGILLIHGFAGDLEEIKPLRDHLQRMGYKVESPLLAGHGTTKRELAGTSLEEWIASAERSYLEISEKCEKVIVIGFSMGGLIAFNLWHYGYAGMVTINMPVYYWNPKIILANLMRDFRQYGKKYLSVSTDKSLSSLLEFQKLLTKTKPMIGNITCRTLVVQALDDDTVHHRSAGYISKHLRAEKTVRLLPHGGHMILQSESGREVCDIISEFIQTC